VVDKSLPGKLIVKKPDCIIRLWGFLAKFTTTGGAFGFGDKIEALNEMKTLNILPEIFPQSW
jgi:hypothetical protein